ncbi:MAG: ROK family glucokinase [Clostridia bacterium]|nr:ROK family glucokinase [Clostridia bacterium]
MYKLGIDLGGTNIVAGVVDENYNIAGVGKAKTRAPRPAEEVADDMAKTVFEAIENAGISIDDIDYMGIGSPGAVDAENGTVIYSSNLAFNDVALTKMMTERVGKEFYIGNDANAAAYGEFIAGAGKGTKNFVAVTLGTGVGGGIIINGEIYTGFNGIAGELGHFSIEMDGVICSCGRSGCWEAYASATALIRQTKQAMNRYPESEMWNLCGGNIDNVSGLTAFNALRRGDYAAEGVVNKYIQYLATGIANIITIFQPEIICIGGGISKEGDTLIAPLRKIVAGEKFVRNAKKKTEIKAATLGNDAGIIGAAYLCNLYK